VLPDGKLSVTLEDSLTFIGKITVDYAPLIATPSTIDYRGIAVGTVGVVLFTRDDYKAGVWITPINQTLQNATPEHLLETDQTVQYSQHVSGRVDILHSNGTKESQLPDGTLIKQTHNKRAQLSNTLERAEKTPLKRRVKTGVGESELIDQTDLPTQPAVDLDIKHSSGSNAYITADGEIGLETNDGYNFYLKPGREKARGVDGEVDRTPQEDANRVAAGIYFEGENGFTLSYHSDPENQQSVYFRATMPNGHIIEAMQGAVSRIRVITELGKQLLLDDTNNRVQLIHSAGKNITQDVDNTVVTDPLEVVVNAPIVKLGGAGAVRAVALNGDSTPSGPIVATSTRVFGI
jgi:hypothetical protein